MAGSSRRNSIEDTSMQTSTPLAGSPMETTPEHSPSLSPIASPSAKQARRSQQEQQQATESVGPFAKGATHPKSKENAEGSDEHLEHLEDQVSPTESEDGKTLYELAETREDFLYSSGHSQYKKNRSQILNQTLEQYSTNWGVRIEFLKRLPFEHILSIEPEGSGVFRLPIRTFEHKDGKRYGLFCYHDDQGVTFTICYCPEVKKEDEQLENLDVRNSRLDEPFSAFSKKELEAVAHYYFTLASSLRIIHIGPSTKTSTKTYCTDLLSACIAIEGTNKNKDKHRTSDTIDTRIDYSYVALTGSSKSRKGLKSKPTRKYIGKDYNEADVSDCVPGSSPESSPEKPRSSRRQEKIEGDLKTVLDDVNR
ncbi:hypothetical protein K491DRAFT_721480 [Lophiostoma macrostomum CBS 122681]|uniref:Uncharacterized protein n=1 Tax=Lophiostoma macrostomum CBS 122681 TaxID=1314788 RepID=A0A6A6SPK9_9PLEO|nr:hypothetical protein K491DRAFT_721480 [Lophiostoma macrostomum CBS 122681]